MKCKAFVDATITLGELDRRIYGQFIEHLGECIYGGIWAGENSRISNIKGYRLDVLEAIKQLNCSIVRWPGGNFSSGYHWQDGIGPKDQRPRRYDMAWGQEEPNAFGTDEFLEWCRLIGAEPYIVVNAGNGTPEEAANWVEYCNSAKNTCFSNLRKKYGQEKPYNVKIWGIGNELYGEWQIGFCTDGAECARRTIEFANEMRKVDPEIKLVAVGCEDPEWNIEMIKNAGKYFDYLSIHIYINGNKPYRELVASSIDIERRLNNVFWFVQAIRQKYSIKNDIKIAFDEWNVWYPEATSPLLMQLTSIKDAVFTGGVLNTLHRLCKKVPIATFAQTVNVLPLIIASNDGRIVFTPQYLVFKMYGENFGTYVLSAIVDSPLYLSSELKEFVPFIDLSATLTKDGKILYLYIVNRHEIEAAEIQIEFKGFKPSRGSVQFVAGESIEDKNTLDDPSKVKIEESSIEIKDDKVYLKLKPHSVNVIKLM